VDQQLTATTRTQLSTAMDVTWSLLLHAHCIGPTETGRLGFDRLQTGKHAHLTSNAIGAEGYFPVGRSENHPFLPKVLTLPVRG